MHSLAYVPGSFTTRRSAAFLSEALPVPQQRTLLSLHGSSSGSPRPTVSGTSSQQSAEARAQTTAMQASEPREPRRLGRSDEVTDVTRAHAEHRPSAELRTEVGKSSETWT